jgi:hypothetical protein
MSDAGGSAAAPAPAWPTPERSTPFKLLIPVLIGLVSVTGAVVAWRSSQSGEYATDKDRQAVAETVTEAQTDASNQIIVEDARARFATHLQNVVAATLMEADAADTSDASRAAALDDEAAERRAIAERALAGGPSPLALAQYVTDADGDGTPEFDEERFTDDLDFLSASNTQVDPSQTVREANRLRNESQWLDGVLVPMVGAIVLLTLAQISTRRGLRLGLAGAGAVVWVASSIMAISGLR